LTEESFGVLLGHLRTFNANVIWVTRSSQVAAEDPRAAMVLGLARSLRNEMHLKFYTVEVDSITPTTTVAGIVSDLLLKVKAPQTGTETMDPDWEYAIDNGQTLVPRMHWHTMRDSFMRSGADNVSALKCLDIKTPGLLHTMEWTEKSGSPLKDDEVLVQTRAVGLNFRVCVPPRTRFSMPVLTSCRTFSLLLMSSTTAHPRWVWKVAVSSKP
jgi:hypothetical protein